MKLMSVDDSSWVAGAGLLLISFLNVNYLTNRLAIIESYLRHDHIDVLILCETHTTDSFDASIAGYQLFRFDSPLSYSGMLLYVKEGLDFNVLNASSINRHDCITFTVNTERHNIQISALYVSPSTKACISLFPEVVDSQVLVGDFNAKHKTFGCINSNNSGRALKKFTQEYSFLILNSKSHTFYHRSYPYSDILDLVFDSKSILDSVLSCEVGPDVNSDHLPVTLKLDLRPKRQTLVKCKCLNYARADWHAFMHTLEQQADHFDPSNPAEIEWEAYDINQIITNAIKIHIPIKKQTGRQLPQHILTDIKTKRRLRKQLQRTHCMQLKQQLTSEINRLHKNITLQIKNFDNQRIQSFLQSIPQENEQPGTFYKKVRSHTKQHKSYTTLKDSNGNSITSHQNISNTFASLLQQKMDVHTDFYDRDFQTRVDSAIDSQRYLFEPLSCDAEYSGDASGITADIDIHDIMSTLEKIKSNSATGPDQISYTVLKHLPLRFLDRLASLFNSIVRLGYFPSIWKSGHIVMLHKPGKPKTDPNNYRPITLNSCICKTLERIINCRLNNYLEAKGLVNEFQGAFRRGRGTHDQIFRVYNSAKLNSREGKATAAVFLDIAQAFDSVWHKGLKYKLAKLPPPVCRLLSNYLDNRRLQVLQESCLLFFFS